VEIEFMRQYSPCSCAVLFSERCVRFPALHGEFRRVPRTFDIANSQVELRHSARTHTSG
jgi:hypothetical protein